MSLQSPDYAAFERLLSEFMRNYGSQCKDMETGWEVYKDDFGAPLFPAPYLKVTLKEDADIFSDLQNHKQIRVNTNRH